VAGTVASAYVLPGIHATNISAALILGAALGFVYMLLRPLIKLVTLPFAILSLGLLYVLVDAGILWLVAQAFGGYEIASFGWAIVASVLINLLRKVFRSAA
jgi:putative membrane protein